MCTHSSNSLTYEEFRMDLWRCLENLRRIAKTFWKSSGLLSMSARRSTHSDLSYYHAVYPTCPFG